MEQKIKKEFKILLILPTPIQKKGISYDYMFPIGLGYISSTMKKKGYDITCLNLNHIEGTAEEILKKTLKIKKYDVVATGHNGLGYLVVKEIIEATRKYSPRSKIVIGGAIITSEPELMAENLKFDFGIIGEGEITVLEVLKAIEKGKNVKNIKGLVYLNEKGKAVITDKRELIEDIDSLPYPDFDGFGFEEYLDNAYTNQHYWTNKYDYPRTYPILCSRGCPFNCTFCYHSIGRRYRQRDINEVIKELEGAIKKYKINIILFYDDMFGFDKQRLSEICEKVKNLIGKFSWDIKWSCQLTVNSVDKEILKKMKDAGCYIASYGFESFSPKVLASMRKPITPKQIDFAIKETFKMGINVMGNFIFGDVAETKETAKETLDYWKNNCKGQVVLGFIQPYAGSEIYWHCIRKGMIKDRIKFISEISRQETVFNMTKEMSDKEMGRLSKEIYRLKTVYTKSVSPNYVKEMPNGTFEIEVTCPFCKQNVEYKNFHLQGKRIYKSYLLCRKCNFRFYLFSPLLKKLNKFPLLYRKGRKLYQLAKWKMKAIRK